MRQAAENTSEELWDAARGVMAGGVSASMRFHPYLGRPFYISRGEGPYLYDLDGRRYLDFNNSNGAALLGHKHPGVQAAVQAGLDAGIIAAAETPFHEQLAHTLTAIIPSAERVRFASTGSEVTLVAIRLARYTTGRTTILKFAGHFHGLTEPFLFGPGPEGTLVPTSGGVPAGYGEDVIVIPWNDPEAFEATMRERGEEIATVIAEPVHYNAGCIPPEPGFLELLRERTRETGTVLIFDEVLSGFRVALGGVQAYAGVTPDLSTFAKALANGMPLSAIVGRADLMEQLAPTGPVAHSGTYSGHLLSVLAALATLDVLQQPGLYDDLRETTDAFYTDLQAIFDRNGLPVRVQGLGARFGLYFGRRERIVRAEEAAGHDHELNRRFVLGCLERGVYFHAYNRAGAPGHCGLTVAHSDADLSEALSVIETVAAELARGNPA